MVLLHKMRELIADEQSDEELHEQEKEIREDLNEKQIDHMVEDSFPASDPPATY